MNEPLTSNKQVEYAMRQLERCRSYGTDLGEYEQVIVILGDEVERMQTRITNLFSALNSKQAKIDALMLEFCPGEMSAEQRAEWAANQRAAVEPVAPSSPPADPDPEPSRADKLRAALKPAGVKVNVLGEADEPDSREPREANPGSTCGPDCGYCGACT